MNRKILLLIVTVIIFSLIFSLSSCDFSQQPDGPNKDQNENENTGNENGGNENGGNENGGNENTGNENGGNENGGNENGGNENGGNENGGNENGGNGEVVLEGIVLVKGGEPKFNIVVSTGAGSAVIKLASQFAKELDELGIKVNVFKDNELDKISDCEILLGAALKNRGEDMNVSAKVLGNDGYVIKASGERILIAGGNADMTEYALDLFKEQYLGITESTESLVNVAVSETLFVEQSTVYPIEKITILEEDLSSYVISYDPNDILVEDIVRDLVNLIYERSGYIINAYRDTSIEDAQRKIIVRTVNFAGNDGFRAYTKGDDLIIECAYTNAFKTAFQKYVEYQFPVSEKEIAIEVNFMYKDHVSTVKYSDFGAVGDGVTDDFEALVLTHEYANVGGQKVIADNSATYYIGESSFGRSITIKTDTDFGNATFIIDDTILSPASGGGNHRKKDVFIVASDNPVSYIPDSERYEMTLKKGQENIGKTFDGDKLMHVVNSNKKVYIRWGSNQNNGSDLAECILVDKDGNVDPSTPIMWDYDQITAIYLYSASDKTITLTGGKFITWACQLWEFEVGSGWRNQDQYYYYNRGILISRSNTVLDGIKHYVEEEGEHGYPYSAFYNVRQANNVLIKNCVMTGRKTYIEDRDLNGDGIIQSTEINKGTSMGSYDISGYLANNVTWQDCTQTNFYKSGSTPYAQSEYWGVMGTNYCKNLTYDGCVLSRFDAHCGVYNATIKDSTIAFAINSVGAGTFLIENTTKLTGNTMLSLRNDYGSTWEGTVIIKDSKLSANNSTAYLVHTSWQDWNFGYTCYIPRIIVDNFQTKAKTVYAYYLNTGNAFTSTKNPLSYTEDYFIISRNKPSGYTLKASNNSTINNSVTITNE